jgi:hypothetical protein
VGEDGDLYDCDLVRIALRKLSPFRSYFLLSHEALDQFTAPSFRFDFCFHVFLATPPDPLTCRSSMAAHKEFFLFWESLTSASLLIFI